MKKILILISVLSVLFIFSCDNKEGNNDSNNSDTTVSSVSEESYTPVNTEEGEKILNNLLAEKGWRDLEKKYGNYNYFYVSKNAEGKYILDWKDDEYEVFSDGFWITAYRLEQTEQDYSVVECYSVSFNGKDTFEISHIHMCATDNNEESETYVRNETSGKDLVHRSYDPKVIKKFTDKINGEWIECEKDGKKFRKTCSSLNISNAPADENRKYPGFWMGMHMDSYIIDIKTVSEDLDDPNMIIFECSEDYTEFKYTTLKFTLAEGLRIAYYDDGTDLNLFMHEDDYQKIDEPKEPCDEDEEY